MNLLKHRIRRRPRSGSELWAEACRLARDKIGIMPVYPWEKRLLRQYLEGETWWRGEPAPPAAGFVDCVDTDYGLVELVDK